MIQDVAVVVPLGCIDHGPASLALEHAGRAPRRGGAGGRSHAFGNGGISAGYTSSGNGRPQLAACTLCSACLAGLCAFRGRAASMGYIYICILLLHTGRSSGQLQLTQAGRLPGHMARVAADA